MTHQTSVVQLPKLIRRVERTAERNQPRSFPSAHPGEFRWESRADENKQSILETARTQEQPPKRGTLHLLRALFRSMESGAIATGVIALSIGDR
ncbi:MAG: hypothetical protein KJZ86_19335 [Caldilineaceae bacterium]|nr:hypothetical protein [Caldilineaceae bacterium]HRJ40973.1 hypothetical protein [Caldilineaceae bacterium]